MNIDHIAIPTDAPIESAKWYAENFGAEILYADNTWSVVQFENIKLSFVVLSQHPAHFAFKVKKFDESDVVKSHRDGTESTYKADPWGNIYELIRYPDET